MPKKSRLDLLVEQTITALAAMGIPISEQKPRARVKMAKVFLSVAGMKPGSKWSEARSDHKLRTRGIIHWMNEYLGEKIKDSSYDDIRRKDLLFPVEAGLVLNSAHRDGAATNDGTRSYALSKETASLLRTLGTSAWEASLEIFLQDRPNLAEELKKRRVQQLIPVVVGSTLIEFGPGEHNELQKAVIEEFLPRFGYGAEVLYVGDTQEKLLFVEKERLLDLGFFELAHEKLPDVLAYSAAKNWLFLIEAVHSANPINEMRKRTLEQLTSRCKADIIYVTAFLNRVAFRKFAPEIAWETEVWIANAPDHLIHFNGDKFLGPHVASLKP